MSVKKRGFGSMSKERLSEVGKKGAEAARRKGVGHRWTSKEAKDAAEKGLKARYQNRDAKKDSGSSALSLNPDRATGPNVIGCSSWPGCKCVSPCHS